MVTMPPPGLATAVALSVSWRLPVHSVCVPVQIICVRVIAGTTAVVAVLVWVHALGFRLTSDGVARALLGDQAQELWGVVGHLHGGKIVGYYARRKQAGRYTGREGGEREGGRQAGRQGGRQAGMQGGGWFDRTTQ
jgi:hypothetical protein